MIEFKGFCKNYKNKTGAENICFVCPDNAVTALIGANGAGKTTLIKAVTGIHYPDSGEVLVNGINPELEPVKVKAETGYLSEIQNLPSYLTVKEFLLQVADLYGVKAGKAAELFSLNDVLNEKIKNLSKGYIQRTAFAAAVMHNPDILVLDEPFSGLDPLQIIELRKLIKSFSNNKTVLLSTHIMQEAENLADNFALIDKGKLLFSGKKEELFSITGCSNLEESFLFLAQGKSEK